MLKKKVNSTTRVFYCLVELHQNYIIRMRILVFLDSNGEIWNEMKLTKPIH